MKNRNVIVGIGWYSQDQWPEYLRLMEGDVDPTHETWLEKAVKMEKQLKSEGFETVRVPVDLADFDLWCAVRKRKRDGAARAAYVQEKTPRR